MTQKEPFGTGQEFRPQTGPGLSLWLRLFVAKTVWPPWAAFRHRGTMQNLSLLRLFVRALLVSAMLVSALPIGAQPRPMEIEDLFRLHRVSDPQISPDGKRVAYVITDVVKEEN